MTTLKHHLKYEGLFFRALPGKEAMKPTYKHYPKCETCNDYDPDKMYGYCPRLDIPIQQEDKFGCNFHSCFFKLMAKRKGKLK